MNKKVAESIKNFFAKPQQVLLCLGVAFFFVYSYLYAATPLIFNSPDETATFVFAKQYQQVESFQLAFSPNPHDLIRPRSVNIFQGNFVPGGFLGLPLLLGAVASYLGQASMLFLPALFSVVSVICLYELWAKVFDKQTAFLSSVFLFFLPQWWHYSSKGFLPNVLFLSTLIISIYAFVKAHDSFSQSNLRRYGLALSGGLFLGLSAIIRPNELVWVAAVGMVVFILLFKKIKWSLLGTMVIAAVLPVLTLMQVQTTTYGSTLATGYNQLGETQASAIAQVTKILFPFGLDFVLTAQHIFHFVFLLFWWQVILVGAGIIAWLKKPEKTGVQKWYSVVFVVISIYLFLYYGSWEIADDLDTNRISIGISYIRYWLPAFIFMLPFMVIGLKALLSTIVQKNKMLFPLSVGALLLAQTLFVYQGRDGLRTIEQTIVEYKEIRSQIVSTTPENAVIVGERIDKIIWPEREVIHFQDQNFDYVEQLPEILEHYPVYWMTLLPEDHVRIWEQKEFSQFGLELDHESTLSSDYQLYRISHADNGEL